MRSVSAVLLTLILACLHVTAQTRNLRPDDLFQLRRIGSTAWAPNGQFVTIELSKPSRWLDGVPANDLSLLDVKTRKLRSLSPRSPAYIGFFNAIWSPNSQRVAFLSVDRQAVVRAWVWTVGTAAATVLPNVEPRIGLNDPPIAWIDGDRLAVMSWEPETIRRGPLHVRVLRGRNVATAWKQAFDGKTASISVLESPAAPRKRIDFARQSQVPVFQTSPVSMGRSTDSIGTAILAGPKPRRFSVCCNSRRAP